MQLRTERRNSFGERLEKPAQRQGMREVFMEFCSNTTIHGVRYFTERGRHWTERFWWIIAIGVSAWFCGSLIQNIWLKWNDSPVTMRFAERDAPVSSIPFPTVTICPTVKTYKHKIDLVSSYLNSKNLSDIELTRLFALIHICDLDYYPKFTEKFTNQSIFDVIEDMALSSLDTLRTCSFQHNAINCGELFVPIFTDEGLCFAFNALNSHDIYTEEMAPEMMTVHNNSYVSHWSLESGYEVATKGANYPIRVFSSKENGALHFEPRISNDNLDYACGGTVQGFKIFLHLPVDAPKIATNSFRVPLSEEVEISIKPQLITTSDGLRKYGPSQRKCYFKSERQLRFFKVYTRTNCKEECLANYTKNRCGCVKFSMPRDTSTRICGAGSISCYKAAKLALFGEDVVDGLEDKDARSIRRRCNCLPACTSIAYNAMIDRAKFDLEDILKVYNISFDALPSDSKRHISRVTVFFRDHKVNTLKRTEQYTYADFLAICGGLLGLCLGISALSVIEFLYFVTLRLYWTLRKWKPQIVVGPFKRQTVNVIPIDTPNASVGHN